MRESVTVSMETYMNMCDEIIRLKSENREKTVYKYKTHPVYGYLGLSVVWVGLTLILIFG